MRAQSLLLAFLLFPALCFGGINSSSSGSAPQAYNDVLLFGAKGDGVTEDGNAILAAVATGGPVYFPAGYTFLMNGKTIIPVAGQRFFGGGTLKKTTHDNELTPAGIQDAPKFFQIHDINDVLVEGLTFHYTRAAAPRLYGITIQNAARTIVRNCRFEGQVTAAFIWKNSTFTQFVGNTCRGGAFGIATGGDGAGNTNGPVYDTIIQGNTFTGSLSEGVDVNWDTERCLISGNIIADSSINGADECIDVGGGVCRDITIIGNVLNGGGRAVNGITIKLDTSRVNVEGNVIFNGKTATDERSSCVAIGNNGTSAPICSVKVSKNFLSGYQGRGIIIHGSATYEDMLFDGNTIACMNVGRGSRGIELGRGTIKDVVISNNSITTFGSIFAAQGILVSVGDKIIIKDNRIKGFGAEGIASTGATNVLISGNNMTLNAAGITVNSPNSIVSDNNVSANTGRGISVGGNSIMLRDNIVKNNGTSAVGKLEAIRIVAGSNMVSLVGNLVTDDQGTPSQRGVNFTGACDRVLIMGNTFYLNSTYNIQGTESLTHSVYSTAENIVF